MKTRIMWIGNKTAGDGLSGPARIGRVSFSISGQSVRHGARLLQRLGGLDGSRANYFDPETGEEFWISGCRKDGMDALYSTEVEIDDDAREEHRRDIRSEPCMAATSSVRARRKD